MFKDIKIQKKTKKELANLVAKKEQRFTVYMENSREAIWRIDFNPPISLQASELQQVLSAFQNSNIGEANDAMARMYGYTKGKQLIGRVFGEFITQSDPKNVETVTALVREKFLMNDMVTYEKNVDGSTGVYLNNIVPAIRNGMVLHIWGSSLDITILSKTQERLKWAMAELENQKKALEEKNIALKELIAQIEIEKRDIKDRVMSNLEQVILPSFDKIVLNNGVGEYLDQHRKTLENLISTFGQKIADSRVKLSAREIEVCNLVRNGLTNKEIAQLLRIALHTVEKHRRMSRKKLGLTSKSINLQTYLSSF